MVVGIKEGGKKKGRKKERRGEKMKEWKRKGQKVAVGEAAYGQEENG